MSKKERERGKEKGTEKNSFVITVNPLVFSGMLGFYTLLLIDLRGKNQRAGPVSYRDSSSSQVKQHNTISYFS